MNEPESEPPIQIVSMSCSQDLTRHDRIVQAVCAGPVGFVLVEQNCLRP